MDHLLAVRRRIMRRFEGGDGYKEKPYGPQPMLAQALRTAQNEPKEMDPSGPNGRQQISHVET